MANPWPSDASDLSALVQQFLVFHGARHVRPVTEDNWKLVPVLLQVPVGRPIPPGLWLVTPWDAPSPSYFEVWLQRHAALAELPDVVVLTSDAPLEAPQWLAATARQHGVQLAMCSAQPPQVLGTTVADAVAVLLEPAIRSEIEVVNPLEHLAALGDPRDPAVFVERLRRTAPGLPVTKALIGLNAAIYAAMVLAVGHYGGHRGGELSLLEVVIGGFPLAQLADWGGNAPNLAEGPTSAWRLLSAAFLHGNLIHIAMNLLVLRQIGDTAERLFGSLNYTFVYFLAALGGSIASLGWHGLTAPGAISVGASGAVFGVMGATLGFALARRDAVPRHVYQQLIRSGLFFTIVNVGLGLSMPVVDNACHLGGLAVGALTGAALSRELPPAPQPPLTVRLAIVGAALTVLGLLYRWVLGMLPV
ncbi:MAG: rhomboid family intramembrane serine protease [Deltaproteobacteria bacterium]|nr:rhomboid family intramembrane serine protease [Deltaproteobacteria bacterium]